MFDPSTLLGQHVIVSLAALLIGYVVIRGLLVSDTKPTWTGLLFATMLFTDVTGFLLPAPGFLPSHATGILSLIALAIAMLARYQHDFAGAWRWIYVASVVTLVWVDAFVGVVQALGKVTFLNRLAPTQADPGFAIIQLAVLALFVWVGLTAARRFHPTPEHHAHRRPA
jgi:hypothetical protein